MKLTKPVFWLISAVWLFAGIWWYGHSSCSSCALPVSANDAGTAAASLPPLIIKDKDWSLQNQDNFKFAKSGNVPVISSSVMATIDSLSKHAGTTDGGSRSINVNGYYSDAEKNIYTSENLGMSRAEAVKKILVSKGINQEKIMTGSSERNDLYFTPNDTLIGGIAIDFADAVAKSAEKLLFEPRTIYFNSGKNSLALTPSLESYLDQANKYLQANPGKKLLIDGYTDNTGDPVKNLKLSEDRAAFVKTELIKKGLSESQMISAGKGIEDPASDNLSTDGRAKNRRVTIKLQ